MFSPSLLLHPREFSGSPFKVASAAPSAIAPERRSIWRKLFWPTKAQGSRALPSPGPAASIWSCDRKARFS